MNTQCIRKLAGVAGALLLLPVASPATASPFTTTPQSCVPAPAGLIGWWSGDDDASDVQANHNGALLNGATFGPGRVGPAFHSDGISGFIGIPDAPDLRPASLTIEGWFNFDTTSDRRVMFTKPVGGTNGNSYALWNWNGTLRGTIYDGFGNSSEVLYNWSRPPFTLDMTLTRH